jgi:glyoxylase-like metal-dependent hydrolase (beta-lactamase superfamily II)
MPFERVRFLNSGYCTQWGYLAGRRSRGWTRFYAVFVHLEHPDHGPALIDTVYSPLFLEATRSFPGRLYRWATPVQLDPRQHAGAVLESRGLRPDEVRRIFVSHFHGDHVAGLRHFPKARFVYRRAAHDLLMGEGRWSQVRHAFLAGLLPADFTARGHGLGEEEFVSGEGPLSEFRVLDYWGDGDLLLVDLPGHAAGHTGYVLRDKAHRLFFVVDATWDVEALLAGRPLPWLSRRLQHSYGEYVRTQEKLRRLAARVGWRFLACHCPRTQAYVS